jgi:predicted glycoside hydrolase/deacetylase ChbG (UPF0249 family)/GT2 family glycosyltransferase
LPKKDKEMNKFTILIPVYNEVEIIDNTIKFIKKNLKKLDLKYYEILIIENGSSDNSFNLLRKLKKLYQNLKIVHLQKADFGEALKIGIVKAKYQKIILFNADWWDIKFLKDSLKLLDKYSIVVGSKILNKESDKRPLLRKLGSMWLTWSLKLLFNYHGSDSHGIKAFRKKDIVNILSLCKSHEIIESEILIRINNLNLPIKELSVAIKEIRPARVSFIKRCYRVFRELIILKINFNLKDFFLLTSIRENFFSNNKQKFHIDDVGYNKIINKEARLKLEQKKIFSFSVLVNGSSLKNIILVIKKYPHIEVFLHFNLIEGKPISSLVNISSLINPQGNFYDKYQFICRILTHRIDESDIKTELLSQINLLQKYKIKISGIDSHQHMHALSPIAEVVNQIAKDKKIKFVRSYSQMQTQTIWGFSKILIFKILSILSHLIYFNKIQLPISWIEKKWSDFYIGSWEKINTRKIEKHQVLVIHPGLNYDK